MDIKSYRDLIVWQKAMHVAKCTYIVVKKLPKEEMYALANQMRRAAISIPSNIAEGKTRNSTKEFIQFLAIANGSRAELETQLLLCVEIGYLTTPEIQELTHRLEEVGKMLHSLQKALLSNP